MFNLNDFFSMQMRIEDLQESARLFKNKTNGITLSEKRFQKLKKFWKQRNEVVRRRAKTTRFFRTDPHWLQRDQFGLTPYQRQLLREAVPCGPPPEAYPQVVKIRQGHSYVAEAPQEFWYTARGHTWLDTRGMDEADNEWAESDWEYQVLMDDFRTEVDEECYVPQQWCLRDLPMDIHAPTREVDEELLFYQAIQENKEIFLGYANVLRHQGGRCLGQTRKNHVCDAEIDCVCGFCSVHCACNRAFHKEEERRLRALWTQGEALSASRARVEKNTRQLLDEAERHLTRIRKTMDKEDFFVPSLFGDLPTGQAHGAGFGMGPFDVNHNGLPDFSNINIQHHVPQLEDLLKFLKEFNPKVSWTRVFMDFGFCLTHMITGSNTTRMIALVQFISDLRLPTDHMGWLQDKVKRWFKKPNAQAGAGDLFVPLLTFVGVVMGLLGVSKLPSDKSVDSFIQRLSKIGACIKSVETLKEYSQDAVEVVFDYVRTTFFGYSKTDLDEFKSYNEWCDEVASLNTPRFEDRVRTDKTLPAQITSLLQQADELLKMLDRLRVPAAQRSRFNAHYQWLVRARSEVAHCTAGKHIPRVPPIIVHIIGGTGVGKSEATSLLNCRLLTRLGFTNPDDLSTLVYYRDATQDRFDGFRTEVQGVVVDDFGSRVDSEANPSGEPFEAIRMNNSAVWQLPMANLVEKGAVFFRAKYVIWTSNRATFNFKSITNPEAVLRRVNCKFIQRPRPEFATKRMIGTEEVEVLDPVKIAEAAKTNPDVYSDVWLFDEVDPHVESQDTQQEDYAGVVIKRRGLSFEEMAAICEETLVQAQIRGQAKLDHTTAYFTRCAAERARERKAQAASAPAPDEDGSEESDISEEEPQAGPSGAAHGWFDYFRRSEPKEEEATTSTEAGSSQESKEKPKEKSKKKKTTVDVHVRIASILNDSSLFQEVDEDTITSTEDGPHDFSGLIGAGCFTVHPRAEVRAKKAYYNAMRFFKAAADSTDDARKKLFNRVFCALFAGGTSLVQPCNAHSRFWEYYERFNCFAREKWNTAWHWRPVWLQKTMSAAYEVLVITLKICCFSVLLWACGTVFFWLFPSLDAERNAMIAELEAAKEVRDRLEHSTPDLDVAIAYMELKLGLPPSRKEVNTEACLSRINIDHIPLRSAESALSLKEKLHRKEEQYAESHQDKTPGSRRGKVENPSESRQEKTPGSGRRNVEGDAEMASDQNAKEIEMKVSRNIYSIHRIAENGVESFAGNLTFIKGRVALTNRHILSMLKGFAFKIRSTSITRGYTITKEQCESMRTIVIDEGVHADKDVCLIELPRHVQIHADITRFFMTREDFCRHSELDRVCVMGFDSSQTFCKRYSTACKAYDGVFRLCEVGGKSSLVRGWYCYDVQSSPGDCGSILVAFDKAFERKLIGIHMAAYHEGMYTGAGVAIHADLIKSLLQQLNVKNAESLLDGDVPYEGDEIGFEGDFIPHGTAAARSNSCKTTIEPSPVQKLFPGTKTKPAHLRPFWKDGVMIDPLAMARAKADTANHPIDEELLAECVDHFNQLSDTYRKDSDERILSWEEAIAGIAGEDYYTPVKRNTSPGYGWESKLPGKTEWLGEDDYIIDHPAVLQKRDEYLARVAQGKRTGSVFVDTLKDERRPIEKVDQGKTRLFAAGEMVYCLLFRQYFMGFMAHIMRNTITIESCVGLNPYGYDWNQLATRLTSLGPAIVAGDFSNYDGTLAAAILWASLDVVEHFYVNATPEQREIRRALWCDLVNSLHYTLPFDGASVAKVGYIYQWTHSQPSGNPMTVILNSVYHSLVARYVYLLCARESCPEKATLRDYDKYVRHNNYGDDDLYNISEEILPWFNQITMAKHFASFGMTYTDETKGAELVVSRRIGDVSFLKRSFRWDSERARWRAPLTLDTILEMVQWVKRKKNVYELVTETLQEAHYELAQHSRKVFNEYLPLFVRAQKWIQKRRQIHVYLPTYDQIQRIDQIRAGVEVKPCDRRFEQIAANLESTAAVDPTLLEKQVAVGWEGYLALLKRVCPSKTIGYASGKSQSGLSEPDSKTLNTSLATNNNNSINNATEGTTVNDQTIHDENIECNEQEIVCFVEEGPVAREATLKPTYQRLNDLADRTPNDIVSVLGRPIDLGSITWSTDSTGQLGIWRLPRLFLEDPMIKEKLSGFRFVRGNIHLRVQFNAQPFNSGLAKLFYIPLYSAMSSTPTSTGALQGRSAHPGVYIDLAVDTAAEIVVPFNNAMSHFDRLYQMGTMGAVSLEIFSKLQGSPSIEGNVWAWMTEAEVDLPTGVAHSGFRDQAAKIGPVENAARSVAGAASAVTVVPELGSIARLVEWGAKGVGQIAHWFGWSKETNHTPTVKVTPHFGENFANFDGASNAKGLGLSSKNEVEIPTQVFSTEEDEMAISHIVGKECFLRRFKIDETQNKGTLIGSWNVDVAECAVSSFDNERLKNGCVFLNTFLSYLSNLFAFWRGTIKYRLKFVKTPFHSGRLMVVTVPGAGVDTLPTQEEIAKSHRTVIDLRDTNEFTFEVPFKWALPWKSTNEGFFKKGNHPYHNIPHSRVYVYVVNKLIRPPTASAEIEMLVFTSGGNDLQFAAPRIHKYARLLPDLDQRQKWYGLPSGQAQGGTLEVVPEDQLLANKITTGEVITSLRQILRRYNFFSKNRTDFYPYASKAGVTISVQPEEDWYSWVECLYRWYSGGMRLATISLDNTRCIEHRLDVDDQSLESSLPTVLQTFEEPVVEIGVPYYRPSVAQPTFLGVPNLRRPTAGASSYHYTPNFIQPRVKSSAKVDVYRAIPEDFSFGFLLGPPMTVYDPPA